MGDLGLKIRRQVDDVDCTKGAFLGTNTTTDAETFGDECDLGLRSDFDTELAGANDRTGFLAFLSAFLADGQQE